MGNFVKKNLQNVFYRSIPVLPVIRKDFEGVVFNRVSFYLGISGFGTVNLLQTQLCINWFLFTGN